MHKTLKSETARPPQANLKAQQQRFDAFRKDPAVLKAAIERLTKYQYMADFGTCAVNWPLQEQWEKDILAGKMPEL